MFFENWAQFPHPVQGAFVRVDSSVPPTNAWNKLFLIWFRWKQQALFRVVNDHDASHGYFVGFKAYDGTCMVKQQVCREKEFRMRIGHEACTFFAIDPVTKVEIPIKLRHIIESHARLTYRHAPLH